MSRFSSMMKATCPRCRSGKLFTHGAFNLKHIGKMPPSCEVCGQDFVIEPGFYFGATYVSYGLNVGWLIPSFLLLVPGLGLTYEQYVGVAVVLAILLIPLIFRLSRSIWIHFFVKYDPDSIKLKTEKPA